MSLKSREARRAAVAGLAFIAAAGAGATPAEAAIQKQLSYECKYPLIVPGVIDLDITMDIPERWPTKTATEAWKVSAIAKIGGTTPADMGSIRGLTTLKGWSSAYAQLTFDNGAPPTDVAVDLEVAPYTYKKPSQGGPSVIEIGASGTTPKLLISKPAKAKIVIQELLLNMQALDATGKPLTLAPVETNWDDTDHIDSDGDPTTFDVVCRPNPNSNPPFDPVLANVEFFDNTNVKPTVPGSVGGTTTANSISPTWTASTDTDGIKSYKVYVDGVLKATVTGDKLTATIDGLEANKDYSVQVSAVDNKDLEGDKSAAKVLKTGEAPNVKPTAPGNVGGTTTATSISPTWTASTDADGIKSYKVYVDGALKTTVAGDKLTATIDGLASNKDYSVQVSAVDNKDLEGDKSAAKVLKTGEAPNVKPTAPGNLNGTTTHNSATLTWAASTDADGIKSYKVYQGDTVVKTVAGTELTATIDGLTPETDYSFTVSAVDNKDLEGDKSAAKALKTGKVPVIEDKQPPTVPTEVDGVPADIGTTFLVVRWGASEDKLPNPGASGLKGYIIEIDGQEYTAPANATSLKVEDLGPGTDYDVNVYAVDNANNKSEPLLLLLTTLIDNTNVKPTAPTDLDGTTTTNSAKLTWSASTDVDGIASYKVYQDGVLVKTVDGAATTADITGLTADKEYSFQVSAVDKNAAPLEGDKSAAKVLKTAKNPDPVNVKPTAPANVGGTTTTTSISPTWTASTDADGIKSYKVYVDGALKTTVAGDKLTATIDGLASDKDYSVQVSAVDNKDLEGDKSAAKVLKTGQVANQKPTAPTNVGGTTTTNSISPTWGASTDADGIKSYKVYVDGALKTTVAGDKLTATIDGLAEGKGYSVQVSAVDNKDLEGDKSAAKVLTTGTTPNQKPTAPTNVAGTAKETSVDLTWTASTDADGSVASYVIYIDGKKAGTSPTAKFTAGSLKSETKYSFQVAAVDNKGLEGDKSAAVDVTTLKGEIPSEQAPVVTSVVGRTAFANIGGVALVSGKNLSKIQKVTVGTKNASYSSLGGSLALVVLPPLKKGSYDLTITTAGGTSNATKITYISLW